MIIQSILMLSFISIACYCGEETKVQTVEIINNSPHRIMARIEGFGIKERNGIKENYSFKASEIIAAGRIGYLNHRFHFKKNNQKVVCTLYTAVLMIRVKDWEGWGCYGDINTEAITRDPFDVKRVTVKCIPRKIKMH